MIPKSVWLLFAYKSIKLLKRPKPTISLGIFNNTYCNCFQIFKCFRIFRLSYVTRKKLFKKIFFKVVLLWFKIRQDYLIAILFYFRAFEGKFTRKLSLSLYFFWRPHQHFLKLKSET